jgi:hypothetical protein
MDQTPASSGSMRPSSEGLKMSSRKRSDVIRANIGSLMYELQLYQQADNDAAMDRVQAKIDELRRQLMLEEGKEKTSYNVVADQG